MSVFRASAARTSSHGHSSPHQRDDLGRITQVEDFADGVTTLWAYGYDVAGRLETVTHGGAAYASYAYDANGNPLSRTSPAGVESGVDDAQDRLLEYAGAEYSYTANGELTLKVEDADTTRYVYDVLGNLLRVELPDGTVLEYVIDGRNRRVGKRVDGVLAQGFLYGDQLNPVAELDEAGNVVSRFVYGSKPNVPDYIVRGGETFRVLSDHLGSVRMVVNAATGAVVQRMAYDAWGRVLEDTDPGWQPFGFAGGVWEAGTGSVKFGAPNFLAFVDGDPINLIDPDGLSPIGFLAAVGVLLEHAADVDEIAGSILVRLALYCGYLAIAAWIHGKIQLLRASEGLLSDGTRG